LVINFGGPGASGVESLPGFQRQFDRSIRNAFDLVSFDPRGVGSSAPINCHSGFDQIFGADPGTSVGAAQIVAGYRAVAAECLAQAGGKRLAQLGTGNVVRDLNRIRAALRDRRLTYLGYSYGTRIGAIYADRFPRRARALLLDGALDPQADFHTLGADQAQGYEDVLNRLLAECASQPSCPLQPDPEAAFDELLSRVRSDPLPTPGVPGGPLTAGWLYQAVVLGMTYVEAQQPVEHAIAEALATGDGSELLAAAYEQVDRDPQTGSYEDNSNEVFAAVNCLDFPNRLSPQAIAADAQLASLTAPRMGAAGVYEDEALCVGWPVPPRPVQPATAPDAPPILVVGNTGDPETPYPWAQRLVSSLRSARLLTFDGIGHTAYGRVLGNGSRCIDRRGNRYLLRRKLPPAGTVCPAEVPIPVGRRAPTLP